MVAVRFAAITLDLDDTLWPIQPVIERAEAELHRWLQQHAPATAQMFDVPGMRRLREAVALDFPEKNHDFTWLRHRAIEQALCAAGDDMALTDAAFAHFFHWRQQVVLYPDALPALKALSARWPLMALTNGNADLAVVGLADYFKAGILSARVFGLGKPHRAFFDAGCARLGVRPEQVLHVGDDWQLDVEGAHHAGLQAAWIQRDHHPDRPADSPVQPWFAGRSLIDLVSRLEAGL
jgi:HAD superfamily hydrolase (TIGR01549 family)